MPERWEDARHDEEADRRDRMDRLDRAMEKADIPAVIREHDERDQRRTESTRRLLEDIRRA